MAAAPLVATEQQGQEGEGERRAATVGSGRRSARDRRPAPKPFDPGHGAASTWAEQGAAEQEAPLARAAAYKHGGRTQPTVAADQRKRSAGREWVGKAAVRVFGGVRVGGVVTQWLPGRRGAPSLWHMVHDDGDEEDLDEAEAREALSLALALQGTPATAAAPAGRKPAPKWSWSTEHAWVGKRVVRVFDGEPTGGVIAKWLRADREEEALWHMVHDDGDEEDLEVQEVREALRRAATDTGGHHMAGKRVATAAAGKKRARSRKPSQESRRRQHEKPCRKCRRPGGVCDRRGPSTRLFPLSSDSSQSHSTRWSVPPVCWQTWVLSSPYVHGTRFVFNTAALFVVPSLCIRPRRAPSCDWCGRAPS